MIDSFNQDNAIKQIYERQIDDPKVLGGLWVLRCWMLAAADTLDDGAPNAENLSA